MDGCLEATNGLSSAGQPHYETIRRDLWEQRPHAVVSQCRDSISLTLGIMGRAQVDGRYIRTSILGREKKSRQISGDMMNRCKPKNEDISCGDISSQDWNSPRAQV